MTNNHNLNSNECTCGPDYFDNFCPIHGKIPSEEKWKILRERPENPPENIGKSYKEMEKHS